MRLRWDPEAGPEAGLEVASWTQMEESQLEGWLWENGPPGQRAKDGKSEEAEGCFEEEDAGLNAEPREAESPLSLDTLLGPLPCAFVVTSPPSSSPKSSFRGLNRLWGVEG